MERKLISSGSKFETLIRYSRAVIDGDYVFVSGTTGFNYDDMSISSDLLIQADQCFRNIVAALDQANSHINNAVRVRYIFSNKNDFEPCWPILRKYLGVAKPAATMIVAGLLDDRMKLEVELTARLNDSEATGC